MKPKQFATEYFTKPDNTTSETALRIAIEKGSVSPEMSLRQMATVAGIKNAETVRYYLKKFLKEAEDIKPYKFNIEEAK